MVLTIDIGNTKTKVAVFDGEQLVEHIVFEQFNKEGIVNLFSRFNLLKYVIVSSVNPEKERRIAQLLDEIDAKYHLLSYKSPLPFEIDYLTPETLGKDRIAALAGAYAIADKGNYLVIDCGTCNTYDLLIDGHFVGGNIAPGIQMRLDAMHHFTAALPQCSIENIQCTTNNLEPKRKMHNAQLGLTTHEAILNGAYWGVINEINGYIGKYSKEYDNLKVILTGGLFNLGIIDNSSLLTSHSSLFFEPMLVPKGLNFIAKNISK